MSGFEQNGGVYNVSQANTAGNQFAGTTSKTLNGPTGNRSDNVWIPELFSKNVLMKFRRELVVEGITNSDYFGEISAFGDTVKIINEPTIAIQDYARGKTLTSSTFQDSEVVLTLDQAHAFQFEVDDIEVKLAHVNWEALATSSATYQMKMAYDANVLNYFEDQMGTDFLANKVVGNARHGQFIRVGNGTRTTNIAADTSVANIITELKSDGFKLTNTPTKANVDEIHPLDLISKFALYLDLNDIPEEGRYLVVGPQFVEKLTAADSGLLQVDGIRGGDASAKNGLVAQDVRGFKVYKTNSASAGLLLGGHMSAVATANAIIKTEKARSTKSFADVIRGLHVFGRSIVRKECLVAAYVTYIK